MAKMAKMAINKRGRIDQTNSYVLGSFYFFFWLEFQRKRKKKKKRVVFIFFGNSREMLGILSLLKLQVTTLTTKTEVVGPSIYETPRVHENLTQKKREQDLLPNITSR